MKNESIEMTGSPRPQINEAPAIIDHLNLSRHPEGGWYREVYRSDEILPAGSLPERYNEPHSINTSIYFLLENGDFSAFHRIRSDETWHFYLGSPVIIYILSPDGKYREVILGNNLIGNQELQYTILRDCWFAAKVQTTGSFALVGCTVSPGFEFSDFELAERQQLICLFPKYEELISSLTR
jgi:uncharacterized protein